MIDVNVSESLTPPMELPFLSDELWVLVATHVATDAQSLGHLGRVASRFHAKVVVADEGAAAEQRGAIEELASSEQRSVVEEGARRRCATSTPHVASWSPRQRGQPWLRLLWERQLLSYPPAFAAVHATRAALRTELSVPDGGAVAHQARIPQGEQNNMWAANGMGDGSDFVIEGADLHSGHVVVLEWSQVMIGAVPLRTGRHYMELELLENSLVPGLVPGHTHHSVPSTVRYGVVSESPTTLSAGLAPHALWEPAAVLNPRSQWAQFTDGRGRRYYLRDQNAVETEQQDEAQQVHADDSEQLAHEPTGAVAAAVDPTFASDERLLEALSYEAVASVRVPDEGVRCKMVDNDDDEYYDGIVGEQWFYDAAQGDLMRSAEVREEWQGQRCANEGDTVGLLLDIDAGTLYVYLNGDLLGRMANKLEGQGPFRFAAEICTQAKVRVASKPPPPPPLLSKLVGFELAALFERNDIVTAEDLIGSDQNMLSIYAFGAGVATCKVAEAVAKAQAEVDARGEDRASLWPAGAGAV